MTAPAATAAPHIADTVLPKAAFRVYHAFSLAVLAFVLNPKRFCNGTSRMASGSAHASNTRLTITATASATSGMGNSFNAP